MKRYPTSNLPSHFTTVAKGENLDLLWSRNSRRHKNHSPHLPWNEAGAFSVTSALNQGGGLNAERFVHRWYTLNRGTPRSPWNKASFEIIASQDLRYSWRWSPNSGRHIFMCCPSILSISSDRIDWWIIINSLFYSSLLNCSLLYCADIICLGIARMGIFRIGRFIPFQYQQSDLLCIFGKKNSILCSHKAVQKERQYNSTLIMQRALKRQKSTLLHRSNFIPSFFKTIYFYTPKKWTGVRKNFLIFTVNLHIGERKYFFIPSLIAIFKPFL